jgi:hypothetical protein
VDVITDNLVEPDETVILTLTGDDHAKATIATSPANAATVTIVDNDIAHLSIETTLDAEEGGGNGQFAIFTDKQFSAPVNVTVLIGGSATNGADYTAIGTTIVFPANAPCVRTPVAVTDDALVEGLEKVSIQLQGTSFASALISVGHDRALMEITDNDYARLTVTKLKDAQEATITGMFTVSTDKVIERDVPIELSLGGTATQGVDYEPLNLHLVLPAHQGQLFIHVAPLSDEMVEGDETVDLSLYDVGNENVRYSMSAVAGMKIFDDDTARFSIVSRFNTGERLADGMFQVNSTKIFPGQVSLILNISGSAIPEEDIIPINRRFFLPALSTSATFPVEVIDDWLVEGEEDVIVSIAYVEHARAVADSTPATVLISDNDYATLTIEAVKDASESGTKGMFVVRSDRPVETGVTVTLNHSGGATEGVDYAGLGGSLFFPAHTLSAELPVNALPDALDENDETVMVGLTGTTNENVLISAPPHQWAMIQIHDDDPEPGLSVLPVTGGEASVSFLFTVTLSQASGKTVRVGYNSANIGDAVPWSDFVIASGTLEFNPGETRKTIEVPINDDQIDEYDESFQLLLVHPENAGILVNNGVGTIVDNDPEPQVSLGFTKSRIGENGGTAYLKAILDKPSGKKVVVVPGLSGDAVLGTDYTLGNDSITILPGDLSDSILVMGLSDNLDEMDEELQAAIISAQNAQYDGTAVVTLVIADQDQTITFGALSPKKYGDDGFTPEASSTSGLAIEFTSSDEGVAKIAGNKVTITGAGTATITAHQPGNSLFDPVAGVSQVLTVGKAQLTATAEDKAKVYGQANPALTIAYTGFVNGDGANVLDTKPVATTTATMLSDAGEYPVTVGGGADGNYEFSYTNGKLTIGKATQTITFGELPEVKKGDAPLALTASASSGLAVTYISSDPAKAAITGSSVKIIASGTVEITASQAGNLNYLAAANVTRVLVIKTPDGAELLKYDGPLCYPNPFEGVIVLNEVCRKALSVKMYDLNGKLVLTKRTATNQVDGSMLRDGVYLLEADFGQGIKLKRQVVKK